MKDGERGEKLKTEVVTFAEIHYPCGCISEMQRMNFCNRHMDNAGREATIRELVEAGKQLGLEIAQLKAKLAKAEAKQ